MELLHLKQHAETKLDLSGGKFKFAYEPDILMGYKGAKLGIFLLNESEVLRDTGLADGRVQHRLKLLQRAHNKDKHGSQLLPVSLPIS